MAFLASVCAYADEQQMKKRSKSLGLGIEESAMEAVNQWRYRPYLLNGEQVEVETLITVRCMLQQ